MKTNSFYNPLKIFNSQRKVESENATVDSVFLRPKRDNKYEMKLLWLPSNVRKMAWIEQNTHDYWYDDVDEDGNAKRRLKQVICPTSPYDMNKAGYDACPICCRLKTAWENKDSSPAEKNVYDIFKRKFQGYIPVYIVNSTETDLIGKIKILCYDKDTKKFFQDNIFGDSESGDTIGLDAFVYYDPENEKLNETTHNFIMNVTTKKVTANDKPMLVREYSRKFSIKPTSDGPHDGGWDIEKFLNIDEEIGFTKSVMVKSDPDKLMEFKLTNIDGINRTAQNEEDADEIISSLKKPKPTEKKTSKNDDFDIDEFTKPTPVKKHVEEDEFDEVFNEKATKKQTAADIEDELDLTAINGHTSEAPKPKPVEKKSSIDDDLDELLASI